MASSYGGLLFIALSSTLLLQFPLITAPPPFSGYIYDSCLGGNYTQGSPYQDNLIDLRSSLSSYITPEISKYYSASVGEIPNRVYWVFQCRGDVGSEDCKTCAVTAGREIMSRCPNKKEAVVFYDECWLHYANFSIVSTVQFEPTKYMGNPNNVSDPNPFMAGLSELMEGLVGRAVSATDLFAIGEGNLTTSQNMYGLVQCTQYLSGNDCNTCLRRAVSEFPRCCFGRLGGTVHNPSCNARYETYQFYVDAALPPAPAPPEPNTNTTTTAGTIVGITVPIVLLIIICAFAIIYWRRKRSRSNEDEEFLGIENRPSTFSYSELRNATGDFASTNKLGEGGFGPVYKGMMSDEKAIAVKKLLVTSHQGKSQFVAEVSIISAVQHRNLVKLYGCCIEGENRLLVYEYLKNKSLDQALFGSTALHLDWPTRFNICLGAARGLAYLHEESKPRIVHRDVKASNILLDSELNPKISDFGLAKLYDDKKTHISTRVAGTIGYLAPEYAMRGLLTEKADVFGFGVVALEILSGRPNTDSTLDPEKIYLLERAWTLSETKRGLELVDPTLTSFDEEEAIRMLGISLLCTQASPMMRPSMSRVVAMLTGDIPVSTVTSKPSYLTDWQFNDKSTFMSDDGTSQSNIHFDSSTNATATYGADQSPMAGSQPMLHNVIGNGW